MEKKWVFYIMLSDHMWDDADSAPAGLYLPNGYTEEIGLDEEAWDSVIAFLPSQGFNAVLIDIGDGVKLESHPEIAAPNAWSKEKLAQKLSAMRALGLEPLPKLNFSTCHSTWQKVYRRMTSTPVYYDFCRDVITEVCELFGKPELFHLGMDEEDPRNQERMSSVIIRNESLWWHDAGFLFDVCERNGTRPWVWADYCWDKPEIYYKRMPKSVLQSNWFYGLAQEKGDYHWQRGFEAYEELAAKGYDQIPTASTWNNGQNTMQTFALCRDKLEGEQLKGIMTAPWYRTTMDDLYFLQHDAHRFLLAKQQYYGR